MFFSKVFRSAAGRAPVWVLEPVGSSLRELDNNQDLFDGRARQVRQQHSRRRTSTTVWHWRTEGRVETAVAIDAAANPGQLASVWAQAVGSKEKRVEDSDGFVPLGLPGMVFRVRIRWRGFSGRDVLKGELSETIEAVTRTLPDDCWVALSVRRADKYEEVAALNWIRVHYAAGGQADRMLSTHPLNQGAMAASMYVCAPDVSSADAVCAAISGALPSTNYELSLHLVRDRAFRWGGVGVAGVLAVWWLLSRFVGLPVLSDGVLLIGGGCGLLPELTARFLGFDRVVNRLNRFRSRGLLPPPGRTWRRKLGAFFGGGARSYESGQETAQLGVSALTSRWPLRFTTLLLPHSSVTAFAVPSVAGATTSGPALSLSKPVPPGLRSLESYRLGFDFDGARAGLAERDVYAGVMAFGEPGTGKSRFLHELWAGQLLARHMGLDGSSNPVLGGRVAMVAFETKGEPFHWIRRCNGLGVPYFFVDAADPSTPRIDLFAGPGDPIGQAHQVVAAMRVAFGVEAIGNTALPALRAVMAVAVQVTPEMAAASRAQQGGPMVHAWTLLGGEGSDVAKQLWSTFSRLAARAELDAGAAAADPTPLTAMGRAAADFHRYATMPDRQFRETLGTSITKVEQLAAARSLDDPARPALSWDDVLEHHEVLVVNFGQPQAAPSDGVALDGMTEDSARTWAAMYLAVLRARIQQRCQSWMEQERAVSIFADEVSHVAAATDEVVSWLRDAGRSFGVRLFFATQRPLQLPLQVREALKSFGTVSWFALNSPSMIAEAVADLNVGGGDWTDSDVAHLAPGQALVRSMSGGRRQPPFSCQVPLGERVEPGTWVLSYFDAARPAFLPGGEG